MSKSIEKNRKRTEKEQKKNRKRTEKEQNRNSAYNDPTQTYENDSCVKGVTHDVTHDKGFYFLVTRHT